MDEEQAGGLRAKGEEALGELAQALLENPLFSRAVGQAFGAGERAAAAQRSALKAANVASVADLERLEQRVRSLSGRVEELEDALDELAEAVGELSSLMSARAEPQGPGEAEAAGEG